MPEIDPVMRLLFVFFASATGLHDNYAEKSNCYADKHIICFRCLFSFKPQMVETAFIPTLNGCTFFFFEFSTPGRISSIVYFMASRFSAFGFTVFQFSHFQDFQFLAS